MARSGGWSDLRRELVETSQSLKEFAAHLEATQKVMQNLSRRGVSLRDMGYTPANGSMWACPHCDSAIDSDFVSHIEMHYAAAREMITTHFARQSIER